jgi:DNA-binding NarL/FixJ family response regulator
MPRLYLADAYPVERNAFRLLIHDLRMDLVGETDRWPTVLAQVPIVRPHILVVDWEILPDSPSVAFEGLRKTCPVPLAIILLGHFDPKSKPAVSACADVYISKGETAEQVINSFRVVAKRFTA